MRTCRGERRAYESHADFYAEAYGQHVTCMTRLEAADATLIEARQCEGDWSDAPTPDLSLAWLAGVSVDLSCELGAGPIRTTVRTGEAILIAPGVGSSLQARDAHVIRILAVPYGQLFALAGPGDAQLPQDGNFGRLHADVLRDRMILMVADGSTSRSLGDVGPVADRQVDRQIVWSRSSASFHLVTNAPNGWRVREYDRDGGAIGERRGSGQILVAAGVDASGRLIAVWSDTDTPGDLVAINPDSSLQGLTTLNPRFSELGTPRPADRVSAAIARLLLRHLAAPVEGG